MPRRTNTFQDVVAIVQRHMAGDSVVEESAMLTPTRGGDAREVDVLITSDIAGHRIRVGVEATRQEDRRATVEWVERMIGKHADLPTDKIILYSGSGFTKGALTKAADHNIAAIAAEKMTDEEREDAVLGGLRSLWPKTFRLTPKSATMLVQGPDGSEARFEAPGGLHLYMEDGTALGGTLQEAITNQLRKDPVAIAEQIGLRDITESMDREFAAVWDLRSLTIDGEDCGVFCRYQDAPPGELYRILEVAFRGEAVIEVAQVDLAHERLGSLSVAYGHITLGGSTGLVVATGTAEGGTMTVRFPQRLGSAPPSDLAEDTTRDTSAEV